MTGCHFEGLPSCFDSVQSDTATSQIAVTYFKTRSKQDSVTSIWQTEDYFSKQSSFLLLTRSNQGHHKLLAQ